MHRWERCKNINVDKNITGSLLEVAMCGQYKLSGGTGRGVVGEGGGEFILTVNQAHGTPPFKSFLGSRDGTVVRALASHQCGPGSIPGLGVICGLSLLLVLVFAPRGFSPGTPVFPSPQKPTFPNSNSIWNPRVTGLSVVRLLSVTLVKQS